MRSKLLGVLAIVMVIVSLFGTAATPAIHQKSVSDLSIFQGKKFNAHYRVPNEAQIETLLKDDSVIPTGMSSKEAQPYVQQFMAEWLKHNPVTSNPAKLESMLKKERSKSFQQDVQIVPESPVKSLIVPVEFNTTSETFTSPTNDAGDCINTQITGTWASSLRNMVTRSLGFLISIPPTLS
jgi:hypothetical protein